MKISQIRSTIVPIRRRRSLREERCLCHDVDRSTFPPTTIRDRSEKE